MNDHFASIADNDELPTTFHKVKPATAHFADKGNAPDFTLYIFDRAPDDAA
ncbi:hypothetical protein [Yoonia sp. F2084L]|uniref:hypothetical protein n=1 Tax=Yoonia sp. F2084L TaxID=2926419 RepID=UPI0032B181F3